MKDILPVPDGCLGSVFPHRGRFYPRAAHTHDELEFNLVTAGRANYIIDGRRYELRPQALLWLFPNQLHLLVEISEDFQMWVVVLTQELVRQACRQPVNRALSRPDPPRDFLRLLPLSEARELADLCARISQSTHQPDLHDAALHFLLLQAWTQFLRASDPVHEQALHPAVYRTALLLMDDPTVGDMGTICRQVGMSEAHLSRLFRDQVGQTITDFRNRQRIDRFVDIYGSGKRYTLEEAADQAGFGSYAQFYRVCRRLLGCSPHDWQRQLSAGELRLPRT